ncbi:MAG: DUF4468 domain-containing protein [Fulvivirga sp.]
MRILIITCILTPFISYSQLKIDENSGLYSLQEVVQTNESKEVIFKRAQSWFLSAYSDPKTSIITNDIEEGTIAGKGVVKVTHAMQDRDILHTFRIEVKKGRYRYTITNIVIDWVTESRTTKLEAYKSGVGVKKMKSKINDSLVQLSKSLKAALSTTSEDW